VEAGPLVKGVSDAVHQSFRSEEEARHVFSLASSKGDTKIVGDRRNGANQHTSARSTPRFSSGSTTSNSYPNGSFSTIPSTKTLSPNSKTSLFKPGSNSTNLRPVSYNLSEPAHNSTSHPTTSDRPYINSKKPTEIVPVETRVFKEDTRVLTPQSNPTGLSPSLKQPSRRPRAIVKTPSWLASYPKPQPLSPLDSEYLSLNNFRKGAPSPSHQGISFKSSPLANPGSPSGSSMYRTRTPRMSTISPQSRDSVSDSSILFSPPVRRVHVVHEQDKDPRSPMLSQTSGSK